VSKIWRPALRWHGGKFLQADDIIALFPPHRRYTEGYGGAGSVLLRKERCHAEVYNDLDGEVVNLFRILRDEDAAPRLVRALELTPFARAEFNLAYRQARDPVERARRLVIKSFMGFGSDGATGQYRTGFRASSNRSGTTPATDWRNYPDALPAIIERLRGVVIEQRDAVEVMEKHDGPDTLHFVDPPYLLELRTRTHRRPGGGTYRHELTREQHAALVTALRGLAGMVVLCGYASDLYDHALHDWQRIERRALADGARERTEVIWINPAAVARLGHGPLFERAA
jgi:DNA adenine methylase